MLTLFPETAWMAGTGNERRPLESASPWQRVRSLWKGEGGREGERRVQRGAALMADDDGDTDRLH